MTFQSHQNGGKMPVFLQKIIQFLKYAAELSAYSGADYSIMSPTMPSYHILDLSGLLLTCSPPIPASLPDLPPKASARHPAKKQPAKAVS